MFAGHLLMRRHGQEYDLLIAPAAEACCHQGQSSCGA
jgi:hypothetical protein